MRLQDGHPEGTRAESIVRGGERGEVTERLRHLLAADRDHAGMHPVPRERMPRRLRLHALVLVVREHEVVAGSVHVEAVAEQVQRHRGALDVPARPPGAPG